MAKRTMKNYKETQTRRQFFKEAARKALPIMGVIVFSTTPFSLNATQSSDCASNSCTNGCKGNCTKWCNGTCHTSCDDKCKGSSGK